MCSSTAPEEIDILVQFLSKLPSDILKEIREILKTLLNNINGLENLTETINETFFFNLTILMSKSLLHPNLFQKLFDRFFNKISPLKEGFIEALSKIISSSKEKNKYLEIVF